MTGAKIFIHCILLSNIFSPLFISGSRPPNVDYVEKVIERRNPISETQKLLQVLSNPKLESVKGEKFFNSWYKQHMNGSNFKKDVRNLIKGNIVESKHSKVAPLLLNEKEFTEFKRKNPHHKYIETETLAIMNDQQMEQLKGVKSKIFSC